MIYLKLILKQVQWYLFSIDKWAEPSVLFCFVLPRCHFGTLLSWALQLSRQGTCHKRLFLLNGIQQVVVHLSAHPFRSRHSEKAFIDSHRWFPGNIRDYKHILWNMFICLNATFWAPQLKSNTVVNWPLSELSVWWMNVQP